MPRVQWLLVGLLMASYIGTARSADDIEVFFSPHGGCTEAIVRELDQAKSTLRIQAYYFTSAPIAKAVIDARKRSVKVQAVLDKCNRTDKYSSATFLKNAGAEVLIDAKHAIAHNKIIIIDDQTILTGSFNFTKNAEENNAENLLIIRNQPKLAERYLANFQEHKGHSEPYAGLDTPQPRTKTRRRG